MRSVHVCICHDNNLVIPQFGNVKVIAVSFGETASECINHCLDLRIGKNLVDTCFFHIQDLTADRQDCLIHTVSGRLGRTSRRISLHDEDLAFGRIPALTVSKLAITVKGILLLGQQIRLCPFLCLTDLGSLFCAGKHLL